MVCPGNAGIMAWMRARVLNCQETATSCAYQAGGSLDQAEGATPPPPHKWCRFGNTCSIGSLS